MSDPTTIRVLIVDDHSILREALRVLIDAEPGLGVVGEARDGAEAWRLTAQLNPDVVVMDLSLPRVTGLEALTRITRDAPDVKVLVLTGHEEKGHLHSVIQAGAAGYLLKRSAGPELARAIRTVAQGERYVDASVAELLDANSASPRRAATRPAKEVALTVREGEVLCLLARGFSNKEIAASLSISVKTVETHRARGMTRLGIRSRAALVQYAMIEGWLRGDD